MSKRKMITFDDQMEDDLLYLLTKAREERKKIGRKGPVPGEAAAC